MRKAASPDSGLLPRGWLIEAPRVLTKGRAPLSALEALILSRRGLIDYASLCSLILVVQILASSWYEARYRQRRSVSEGERGSVPRKEMLRTWLYTAFSFVLALVVLCLKFLFARHHVGIWQSEWSFFDREFQSGYMFAPPLADIGYIEIVIGTVFYQFCLYVALRMAHGGFTLGELALVAFGGLALGTEVLGLTRTKVSFNTRIMGAGVLNDGEDMAKDDAFYQDVSSAYAPVNTPNCSHRWIPRHRIFALALACFITAYCSPSSAPPPFAPGEAKAQACACGRLLLWHRRHCCWAGWVMDMVEPWQARSMDLGHFLGFRG